MLVPSGEEGSYDQYGVVIDAGSSGSRVHIYKWQDPLYTLQQNNPESEDSIPRIHLDKAWTDKVTPGLSSFENKPQKAFGEHIRPLLTFAEGVIPTEKIKSTPVFIQATAGMRLLPDKKRNSIISNLCHGLEHSTDFLFQSCNSQVQVIDGETEGLYGWIGLNYLLKNFEHYNSSDLSHSSTGFMDMGGASAQVAYVPSDREEVKKHEDDISTVTLRSLNGETQSWKVFVSTWLGFGANQARNRYLAQIVNSLPENTNSRDDDDFQIRELVDPCMLKGSQRDFTFKGVKFRFSGSGKYTNCAKSMYPLLMKDRPCIEEPCLFNGVHAPNIDFYRDKFIGTSEFWYTANDVFQVGGEYNFHEFSQSVKQFCESDWNEVKKYSDEGKYNGISTDLLVDSCFKANWILSVLHEGFDMPRVGIEAVEHEEDLVDDSKKVAAAVAFQSTDKVGDHDLSWTLGKIVLYVSSLVASPDNDTPVGIMPSASDIDRFGKSFITGSLLDNSSSSVQAGSGSHFFRHILLLFILALLLFAAWSKLSSSNVSPLARVMLVIKSLRQHFSKMRYSELPRMGSLSSLEEGFFVRTGLERDGREGLQVRSRSMINLNDAKSSIQNKFTVEGDDVKNPLKRGNLRPAFSLADFSKFVRSGNTHRKTELEDII